MLLLCLFLLQPLFFIDFHPHSPSFTLIHAHIHTLSLSISHSLTHTHTHTLSLSVSTSLTHTHILSDIYTHTHILSHAHTHTLSLTHTHTHTISLHPQTIGKLSFIDLAGSERGSDLVHNNKQTRYDTTRDSMFYLVILID
jgi:hypothetical protein